jgi:thiamine biosynthesis protein ThiS
MTASISTNGRQVSVSLPITLHQFLISQGLNPSSVVVELNLHALPPSRFPDVFLNPNDQLEIVQIVAGG